MVLLSELNFNLPLQNPVLIFSLILFIILFAPLILNKLKIPHLIGLIIAGAIIGPHGLNFMMRDSSIELFGTVGLLYIMFLAGLEIDLADFKKNSGKSIVFGMYTFLIPMGIGIAAGVYLLEFTLPTSILLASMFASHTLIAYPIVSKLGVAKNRAVNITVGGTLITDTLALLVLAVIVGMSAGEITQEFWLRLGVSVAIFGLIVMLVFPIIGRWFFKRFDDSISQYIFVLGMVFLGAFLAEAAGIEAIIGAFLAGLALNRLIPHTSALMNRIEFVGNALFIPFFLLGVGMLIDYRAFIKDTETIKVALIMTACAVTAKFIAAWLTQKTFKFTKDERRLIFGLSNAQAAATLAAVLVGYKIIIGVTPDGEPIRLLNDSVLNGTILMILATCTIGSFAAQKGAKNVALAESESEEKDTSESVERILIPVNSEYYSEELVNLGLILKSKSNKQGLYALNVIDDSQPYEAAEKKAHKMLEMAAKAASSADNELEVLLRYDINTLNGIANVAKENKITDIILGLTDKKGFIDTFFGDLTQGILSRCDTTTFIYGYIQPIATVKRHIIVVPKDAEREIGFPFWVAKVWNMAKNSGAKLKFYAAQPTIEFLQEVNKKYPTAVEFNVFDEWDDFLVLAREVKSDDSLVVIMSRKNFPSYQVGMHKVQNQLKKYFSKNSFILVYPLQSTDNDGHLDLKNPSVLDPLKENLQRLDNIGKTIGNLLKRK
jgi:Kef-type K+ transport system membrane component KefB/nucleotide-binding universal stress UspA family protein